jgi:transposase
MGVAHSTLKIIWHLLHHQTAYKDLGADYFAKQNLEGQTRSYVNRLKKLGYEVTLTPLAVSA